MTLMITIIMTMMVVSPNTTCSMGFKKKKKEKIPQVCDGLLALLVSLVDGLANKIMFK